MTPDQASAIVEAVREAARSGTEERITVRDWARELLELETVDLPYWPREALLWEFPDREEQTNPPRRWGIDLKEYGPDRICILCAAQFCDPDTVVQARNGLGVPVAHVKTVYQGIRHTLNGLELFTQSGGVLPMMAVSMINASPVCHLHSTQVV